MNRDRHGGPGSNGRSRIIGLADRSGRRQAGSVGGPVASVAAVVVSRPVDLSTVRGTARRGLSLAGAEGIIR
jgi:hypothetical protein